MKGVKRLCGLFLVLFTIFGLSFGVFSNDVSAVNRAQFTSYWRSYYIQQGNNDVVNQSNFNPNLQYAHTLLEYENQNPLMPDKFLKGFSVDWNINDETQFQHKTLVVKLTVVQYSDGLGGEPKSTLKRDARTVLAVNTTSGDKYKESACTGAYADMNGNISSSFVTYTCSLSWDDFASVSNAQLTIGQTRNATVSSPNIGWVGPIANNSYYNPQAGSIQAAWLNYELTGSTDPSYNNIVVISEGVDEMLERDAQDRADLQTNSDNASDSAESAGEDVADAGEQLLYVLTTIYGYLLNPPESNCKISGNTGFMNLGDIDLCSLSPPPAINVIGTLLLIGLCVPFAVSAVSMLIKLVEGVFTT